MIKFFRAIKVAFQYMYRNFGLSFASIVVMTLSFFIVSIVGIAFYGSTLLVQYVDSKPALIVFLRGDLDEEKAQKFSNLVNSSGLAREHSIKDIQYTKDDFATKYPDPELQEALANEDAKSYIPVLTFIYGDSQQNLEDLIQYLETNDEFMKEIVDTTNMDRVGWYSFDQNQASVIKDTNRLISVSGAIVSVFLFVISSILIYITVKLTINYHKREIEIMDLVGADGWFIRLPFVVDGVIYGVLGAFLSTTIILVFWNMILQSSQNLVPRLIEFFGEVPWPIFDARLIVELFAVTICIGSLVGASSSFFAILKYVKK